ncbi:hypothetical protein [Micromonospora echinofusca]|uniref:hypothetical protein n=1 Tax=Micromonospora echinofusca TaxID=47858 RepID=UPI0033C8B19D
MPHDEVLDLLKWHIERYDRLRVSTASRASVVLSAGAILSAGNALLLTQLLSDTTDWMTAWWLLAFTVVALLDAALVVASLVKAANVLVTPRRSRAMLPGGADLPRSLVFNGTDTVAHVKNFDDFRTAVESQSRPEVRRAAEVELWVGIQQHRHRYGRLRESVRLLRLAAIVFVAVLAVVMLVNAAHGF